MGIFTVSNIIAAVKMNGLTESFLPPMILNMTITASIMILFVLLARLILRKAPKIFSYALWAVVLFRLLCPVSVTTHFSLLSLLETPVVENTQHTTAMEYIPYDVVHTPELEVHLPVPPVINEAVNHALPQEHAALGADPLEGDFAIGSMIWLLGIVGMVIYSIASYFRLRRRLVGAALLKENIYLADHIDSPFVMGIFRPRIYLPSSLTEQEQQYILLHEQHHIRRGDHIIKALAFIALCIHWFNPLVWLAFVLSGKDMEMSCDEAVVKKLGEGIRADYSASLLSLATGRRVIAGTPLAFGEGDTKSRIKNMLNWKRAKPTVIFLSAAAVILVLLVCVTNPKTDAPTDEEQTEEDHTEQERPSDTLEVFLSNLHGDDIAEVDWLIDAENKPANTEVATIIRNAMKNGTVSRDLLTADGGPVVGFWFLDIRIADGGADWNSDDMLHLRVGVEENIVEIDCGANLPEGPIWVKDENLYQLVRTSMDVPETHGIDAAALSAYRNILDIYLAQIPYAPSIIESARQELTSLYLAAEREDLGAKIYCIGSVTVVEPSEKAPYLLAGGAYVDSQLRIHGSNESNLLVVVDDEPVGFVNWMWLNEDKGLENCKSTEDLIRAAQNFGSVVKAQQALPLEPYTGALSRNDPAFTVGGEAMALFTGTENSYLVTKSGERYRFPLPYADAELRYAALENGHMDANAETYSYEAAVFQQVRAKDGSVLTEPGVYYYTIDLNTRTYTVRFIAAAAQTAEHAPTAEILTEFYALTGTWQLDVPYTEAANGGISLQELFGTAPEQHDTSLTINNSGFLSVYIGALSGEGTLNPDGDTGRYTGTVTLSSDDEEKQMSVYTFRKSDDSSTYLALDYGSIVLFWTHPAPVSQTPQAAFTSIRAGTPEAVLRMAALAYGQSGDDDAFRTATQILHQSEENGDTLTAYASLFYAAYDASGTRIRDILFPAVLTLRYQDGVYTLQDLQAVPDPARHAEDLRAKFPAELADMILWDASYYEEGLKLQCDAEAAVHFTLASGGTLNEPFTDRSIDWHSPLNGMFERTYETQLRMLDDFERTNPPFFKQQTLEFEACTVLLGTSYHLDSLSRSGTAYILFRDGALGRLPLPTGLSGATVQPETVTEQSDGTLAYQVNIPDVGTYFYTVDPDSRTVSMSDRSG